MLANAIQLVDICAAVEQQPSGLLLFFQGDRRGGEGKQGRSASRDQGYNQIIGAGLARDFRDAMGAQFAITVGNRMAAFVELDATQRRGMTILDVDKTASDPLSQQPLDGLRHFSAGLPGADYIDITE